MAINVASFQKYEKLLGGVYRPNVTLEGSKISQKSVTYFFIGYFCFDDVDVVGLLM